MNCRDFLQQLEHVVETRQSASAELTRHGQSCPDSPCRQAWRDHLLLTEAVSAWKAHETPCSVDLVDAVLNQHVIQRSRPQSVSRRGRLAAFASLASLACVVLALWLTSHSQQEQRLADSAPDGELQAPPLTPPTAMEREQALGEIGSFYALWMQDATQRVTDTVAFVLEEEQQTPEKQRSASWLHIWSDSLIPLGETLDETFRLFRQPADDESLPEALGEKMTG